jgi:hypothetical protein
MFHYDLFPSANPQRDLDKARARAVAARKEAAAIRSRIGTGDDRTRHDRLIELNAVIVGAEREMAAMRRQLGERKRTDDDRAQTLRRMQGNEPKDTGPVYLNEPVRKAVPVVVRSLGYMTKDMRAEDS